MAEAPAYVVAGIDVRIPGRYPEYSRHVPATLEAYGGAALVRGGESHRLEGSPRSRVVVVRFESVTQARAWWTSAEYSRLRTLRHRFADSDVALVEGLEA